MASRLEECPQCGRVFMARPGKSLCGQCSAREVDLVSLVEEAVEQFGLREPEEIARFVRVPTSEVEHLLQSSAILNDSTDVVRPLCARCHENPAQPRSDFCLGCRLALSRELSDAAKSLTAKTKGEGSGLGGASGEPASEREGGPLISGTPTGVSQTLAAKRNRNSPRGGSYTPKGRY